MPRLTPVPFYFLRHGETDWNRLGILQGRTDIDLNGCGVRQAEEVARVVKTLPLASVVCSTLRRARHTAEIATAGMSLPMTARDDLQECSFGILEGQPSSGDWRERWRLGEVIAGGETLDDYMDRAIAALNHALVFKAPVLVVAHGGTFWALDRYALRIPKTAPGTRVANCSLFRLDPPVSDDAPWTSTQLAAPASPSVAIGEAAIPA